MKNKSLVFRLAIWLLLFALIIFLLAYFLGGYDTGSLLLNLLTEILGIFVTVIFVDRIVSQEDKKQWSQTDRLISQRIKKSMIGILSVFAAAFHSYRDTEYVYDPENKGITVENIVNATSKYAFSLLNDIDLSDKIRDFSFREIEMLCNDAQKRGLELSNIINTFSLRISPIEMETLIAIQDAVIGIERMLPNKTVWVNEENDDMFWAMKTSTTDILDEQITQCLTEIKKIYKDYQSLFSS